jgi:hypothetical protein
LEAGIAVEELMKRTGHHTAKGIINYKRNTPTDDAAMNLAMMAHAAGQPVQIDPVRQAFAAARPHTSAAALVDSYLQPHSSAADAADSSSCFWF